MSNESRGFLAHPLFVAVVVVCLGAAGFLLQRYYFDADRSAVRLEVQALEQVTELIGDLPNADGTTVYCDTMRLKLLVAHNGEGNSRVSVLRLGVRHEIANETVDLTGCRIDPLAGRPHGIVGAESYKIHFRRNGVDARHFVSQTNSSVIDPANLITKQSGPAFISIARDDAPVVFDIIVTNVRKDLLSITFVAETDVEDQQPTSTSPFLIAGAR